jgi:light-regulated signal transduction histidine kinase (bacteriophytochrome)
VILPVLWFMLYGVRWELVASLGLIALRFLVPIWLDGITGTAASSYRGAFLFTITCGLVGFVGQSIVRDLRATTRGEAKALADLAQANRGLARSNTDLEEFAYVASHELQEPLRSVGGFTKLLEQRYRGRLDDEADGFIGYIVAGVGRMQALIDDLLRYSRSQQDELSYEPVDSRDLVGHTLTSLDAAVRETGAEVELGELPTLVADRRGLDQVFQNLLSNALKFGDGRPPRVTVSATQDDGAWTFAVADNGVGVDTANAERAFHMFQRLHSREKYAGTGMGLAICKRIVERHGGRISCEPRTGGGTVFRFTIPDALESSA